MRNRYPYHKHRPKIIRKKDIRPDAHSGLKKIFNLIGVPERKPFTPDPFQLNAVSMIQQGDCLVTAPTGSGKTWIATEAIAEIRQRGGSAWYASPLKALTNAKYIEFSHLFGKENTGILTGDRKENPDAPIIAGTTEILRNQLYDAMHHGTDLNTDLVILDEAHFIGDAERGVVWEEILIYLPERIPILMLSATIGNAKHIAEWLSSIRCKACHVVQEFNRQVPLFPLFFHPKGTLFPLLETTDILKKTSRLHKKVKDHSHNKHAVRLMAPGRLPPFVQILTVLRKYNLLPAIFFLKSRADCDQALEQFQNTKQTDDSRKEKIASRIHALSEDNPYLASYRQKQPLEKYAIAAHHSGQLPAWKLLIESLMTAGLLDAVFATSTVAAGVNFPARTIAFLNSDRFNGVEFKPLNATEFHQMTGRAGRRGMDKIGFALAIPDKYLDIRLIARLIHAMPADVHSQIKINFSMCLNLLLSHTPDQISVLLEKSFAAYEIDRKKNQKKKVYNLDENFKRHYNFLISTDFAHKDGRLTEDGIWASRLRVDQPLLIAEGFRLNLFPETAPRMLAAIISAFVNDRETDDRGIKDIIPNPLKKALLKTIRSLQPFILVMIEQGFEIRPIYFKPSLAIYLWASGVRTWDEVMNSAGYSDGDLAMLILRTADHLRHIISLHDVFPTVSKTAQEAIDLLLRPPVIE